MVSPGSNRKHRNTRSSCFGLNCLNWCDSDLLVQTHLEVLESKDVQDADGLEVFSAPDAIVDFADDPVEALRVKCHGHGVPGVHRLERNRRRTALRTYQIWRLKLSLKAKIKGFSVALFSKCFTVTVFWGFCDRPVPQWAAWRSPRPWGSWSGESGPQPADPSSVPGAQTPGWELQMNTEIWDDNQRKHVCSLDPDVVL